MGNFSFNMICDHLISIAYKMKAFSAEARKEFFFFFSSKEQELISSVPSDSKFNDL